MRRLALLLATLMLALSTASSASAQADPYGGAPVQNLAPGEIFTELQLPANPQPGDTFTILVAGLEPGSFVEVTIVWTDATNETAAMGNVRALAFVGALSQTLSGTANANGVASLSATIPAGVDPTAPVTAAAAGTAANGAPAVASDTDDAGAPGSDTGASGDAGAPTTPATGAESGVLALISLGLVGACAGAVLFARRRNMQQTAA